MAEIEKMYKNANVKKRWNSTPYGGIEEYYPPFTEEKQLGLFKWLAFKDYIAIISHPSGGYYAECGEYRADQNSLEECIATLVNNLWQDLTKEERQQVKEVLE